MFLRCFVDVACFGVFYSVKLKLIQQLIIVELPLLTAAAVISLGYHSNLIPTTLLVMEVAPPLSGGHWMQLELQLDFLQCKTGAIWWLLVRITVATTETKLV
ncbi:hypothetical protein ILYODFUR_038494 [Ilyodon furcidens]|uniref:Uncharacterized protein n=1 Tax=Ilyodon furcidens TaxID=33524 RepID=A0ABV0TUJ6_9TELE